MQAGDWLRAARAHRRLSQRELAELAGVTRSTVDRIESGAVVPRWNTMIAILASIGWGVEVRDAHGRYLPVRETPGGHVDSGGRRFPAHLEAGPTPGYWSNTGGRWWGWGRLAWTDTNPDVPTHTYWRRMPLHQLSGHQWDVIKICVWDDAT